MYKDKDKQREANKARQRRYRVNRGLKAYPKGVTESGRDKQGVTETKRDEAIEFMSKSAGITERAEPKRGKDIKCFADLPSSGAIDYVPGRSVNHVSLVIGKPGDEDYNGICTEAWRAERGR